MSGIRIAGVVGIKVRPDSTRFDDELESQLKRKHDKGVRVPVVPVKAKDFEARLDKIAEDDSTKLKLPVAPQFRDLLSQVRREVKNTQAEIIAKDIKLKLGVVIDDGALMGGVRSSVRKIKQSVSRSRPEVKLVAALDQREFKQNFDNLVHQVNDTQVDLNANLDRTGRVRTQLSELTRNRYLDIIVRINKRSLLTAQATLESLFGLNILRSGGLMLERFVRNLDTYARRLGTIGIATGNVSAGVLTLAANITTLGGSIGQLGGFALFLPTAVGAVGAFAAVGVAAFKDFKGAIDGDVEAIRAIPPEARKAADALRGSWSNIQRPVQASLWSQMSGAFETLVRDVFPELRRGMISVGSQAGKMTSELLHSFSDLGGDGVFSGMFANMAEGMRRAGMGVRPFMGAIIQLGSVGSEYLPKLGTWLKDASDTFAAWVRRSSDAGKVTQWIENATTAAHNLGRSLSATKGIFSGIADAARAAGSTNLGTFADTLERIRNIVEGGTFQVAMANLFGGAREAMAGLRDGLKDFFSFVAENSGSFREVMVIAGTTAGSIISAVSQSMNNPSFMGGMVNFFRGLQGGVQGFLSYMPAVVSGIGSVGDLLGTLLQNLLPVVGQMFGGVADAFQAIKPAIQGVVPILTNFSSGVLSVIVQMLQLASSLIAPVLDLFGALPGGIQNLVLMGLLLARLGSGKRSPLGGGVVDPWVAAGGTRSVQRSSEQSMRVYQNHFDRIRAEAARIPPSLRTAFNPAVFDPFRQTLSHLPGEVRRAYRGIAGESGPLAGRRLQLFDTSRVTRDLSTQLAHAYRQAAGITGPIATRVVQNALTGAFQRADMQTAAQRASANLASAMMRSEGSLRAAADRLATAITPKLPPQAQQRLAQQFSSMVRTVYADPSAVRSAAAAAGRIGPAFQRELARGFASASAPRINIGSALARQIDSQLTAVGRNLGGALLRAMPPDTSRILASRIVGPGFGSAIAGGMSTQMVAAIRNATGPGIASAIAGSVRSAIPATQAQARALASAVGSTLRTSLASSVSRANISLAPVMAQLADRTAMARFSGWLSSSFQGAMAGAARTIQAGGAGLVRGFQGVMSGIRSAGQGLLGFFGGPWGVAIIAAITALMDISRANAATKAAADQMRQNYHRIAQAAAEAGEAVSGPAGLAAALQSVESIMDKQVGWGEEDWWGDKKLTTLAGIFRQYGFSPEEIAAVGTGAGSDAAKAFVDGLRRKLEDDSGNWLTRLGNRWFGNKYKTMADEAAAELDTFVKNAPSAAERLDEVWKGSTRPTLISNVVKGLREDLPAGAKIGIGSIKNVQRGVDGFVIRSERSIEQFSNAFANALGGSPKEMQKNNRIIMDSLVGLGATATEIGSKDYWTPMINGLLNADIPVSRLQKALESFGYEADEASSKIAQRFGPALDGLGRPLTVAGEQIYKIGKNSLGFTEVATALSQVTGVDTRSLERVFNLFGTDPASVSKGLYDMGFGFKEINGVLSAMGVPADTAASALAKITTKISETNGYAQRQAALKEYAKALDEIGRAGGSAAEQAERIIAAMDKLNGGKLSSEQANIELYRAVDALKQEIGPDVKQYESIVNKVAKGLKVSAPEAKILAEGLKAAGIDGKVAGEAIARIKLGVGTAEDVASLQGSLAELGATKIDWSEIVDPRTGDLMVTTSETARTLATTFADIGQKGLTAAKTEFDRVYESTGDVGKAMLAAKGVTDGYTGTLQPLIDRLGLSGAAVTALKDKYSLLPSKVLTAILMTGDESVKAKTADVIARLEPLTRGVKTVHLGAIDSQLQGVLRAAGIKLTTYDGSTYSAELDANDKTARDSLAAFVEWARKQRADMTLGYTVDWSGYNQWGRAGGASSLANRPMANGGILEFYANGGIRPSVKHFARGHENHIAQIAPAGAYRIWAESETGGEAYIPLSNAKRARSEAILAEVANRFGMELTRQRKIRSFADGDSGTGGFGGSKTVTVAVTQNFPQAEPSSRTLAAAGAVATALG